MEACWFVWLLSVTYFQMRLGGLTVVDVVHKRHTQTLSHDRYLRIHEESRLCALARRTYAHPRDLEKAQYTLQSSSTG